jgi:phosphoglycerate dehydrogenase-like enzyme
VPFHIAITADLFKPDGSCRYVDIGLGVVDGQSNITKQPLDEYRPILGADQIAGANGAVVLAPRVTRETFAESDDFLAIARFGVGYDSVDVPACTAADVALLISAGAVDRPVADATVGWMIALGHHLRKKDELVRTGRWDERSGYMGCELRGRTFGAVGLGGIARAVLRLLAPFEMNPPIAFDPFISKATADGLGVRLVSLAELMREADFVSIHCPLSAETTNLIGAGELALMKRTAYLINTARGGIVSEPALLEVLRARRIAGAAIDCFVGEPLGADNPWKDLDNVLLAPHSIAWTDELFRDVGRAAFAGLVDLARGRVPRVVVNREVLDRPGFQKKWQRLRVE